MMRDRHSAQCGCGLANKKRKNTYFAFSSPSGESVQALMS